MTEITQYADISAVNLARASRWHPAGLASWSMSDWAVALHGEVGEVCEAIESLLSSNSHGDLVDLQVLKYAVGEELGDVYAYADLFAQAAGFRFIDAIAARVDRQIYTGTPWQAALSLSAASGKLCDVVKKLNRCRDGLAGNKLTEQQLREHLPEYIGRIGLRCSLIANRIGLELMPCVRAKFNTVSNRMGFPERL